MLSSSDGYSAALESHGRGYFNCCKRAYAAFFNYSFPWLGLQCLKIYTAIETGDTHPLMLIRQHGSLNICLPSRNDIISIKKLIELIRRKCQLITERLQVGIRYKVQGIILREDIPLLIRQQIFQKLSHDNDIKSIKD